MNRSRLELVRDGLGLRALGSKGKFIVLLPGRSPGSNVPSGALSYHQRPALPSEKRKYAFSKAMAGR